MGFSNTIVVVSVMVKIVHKMHAEFALVIIIPVGIVCRYQMDRTSMMLVAYVMGGIKRV